MHWPRHFIVILLLKPSGKTLKSLRNQVLYQLQLEVHQDPKKLQKCGKIISITYLTVGNDKYKEFVCNNSSQYICDVNTMQSLMCKLLFNSAVGSDGISAEHICFADSTVALYLSLFFNICFLHGYIFKTCINTVIVPILKNKNGNHQDCGNYKLIATATVVSKLFEQVILINIKNFLDTTDNQFGFKTKHSTDMCIFLLKQAIFYYITCGSPIFCVFLDASKAFDQVNHYLLFQKLIVCNVPM